MNVVSLIPRDSYRWTNIPQILRGWGRKAISKRLWFAPMVYRIPLRNWDERDEHDYTPNMVPSECEALLNWTSITNPHKLKASIGVTEGGL